MPVSELAKEFLHQVLFLVDPVHLNERFSCRLVPVGFAGPSAILRGAFIWLISFGLNAVGSRRGTRVGVCPCPGVTRVPEPLVWLSSAPRGARFWCCFISAAGLRVVVAGFA